MSMLLAQNCVSRTINITHLKNILRQIESDRDNIRNDRSPLWIVEDPLWSIDAVGGDYIISLSTSKLPVDTCHPEPPSCELATYAKCLCNLITIKTLLS